MDLSRVLGAAGFSLKQPGITFRRKVDPFFYDGIGMVFCGIQESGIR